MHKKAVMTDDPMPDTLTVAEQMGHVAAKAFAQFWWSEAHRIAEQIDDPAARWEIMVQALHRIGWPDS